MILRAKCQKFSGVIPQIPVVKGTDPPTLTSGTAVRLRPCREDLEQFQFLVKKIP